MRRVHAILSSVSKQENRDDIEILLSLSDVAKDFGLGELFSTLSHILEPVAPILEQVHWFIGPFLGRAREELAADRSSPTTEGE